jgi:hypothetical protein
VHRGPTVDELEVRYQEGVIIMMRKILISMLLACFLIPEGFVLAAPETESRAIEAMQIWLKLVDEGNYTQSWANACQYFKGIVKQNQWEQAMKGARQPLGKALSRNLKGAEYKTSLPGAPDGEFVIIMFESSFENKKSAIETVTAMLEKDGMWRVAGYFIN